MSLQAGREHLGRGAWEEARASFEAQLASDPSSADALEGLGWALFWMDAWDESFARREDAYRRFLETGDRASAARVATGLAVDVADMHGLAVSSGWLQRARTLLATIETGPAHGWHALWEGHFARMFEHDLERAKAQTHLAQEIACEFEIRDLELLASALDGLIKVTSGQVLDGMRQLDEAAAAAVAGEFSDLDSVATTCCLLLHACERVRDYDRAAQWGERIELLAGKWRIGSMFLFCEVEHAALLVGRGEWTEAERELDRAIAKIESKRPLAVGSALAQLGELRRRQGRIPEARALFARAEGNTLATLASAALALDEGDADRCALLVDRLQRRRMAEKWVERAVALDLLVRSRRDAAALEELREIAEMVHTDLVRAIAAAAEAFLCEDADRARCLLEDAIDGFEAARAPYESARARIDLARVLRASGRDAAADEEQAKALELFRRLGAAADLARHDTPAPTPVTPVSRLTKREVEVLGLVARGLSDKEIAATLRLSEHTVHRHVANILAKLDVSSRAAAVGMAVSGHLLAERR